MGPGDPVLDGPAAPHADDVPWEAQVWVELRREQVVDDKVLCTVLRDGVAVGRVVFSNFETMVVVYQLELEASVEGTGTEKAVLDMLMARFRQGDPPEVYIHVGISRVSTVQAYKSSPLHRGALLTGGLDGQVLYHDRLVHISEEQLAALSDAEAVGPVGLVLTWARDLELLDEEGDIELAQLVRLLHSATSSARIGALRELSTNGAFTEEARDRAYMYALLDNSYEVRRFASIGVSGFFPGVPYHPSVDLLMAHLDKPLLSIEEMGGIWPTMPPGFAYSPAHGRRNKRYGLMWVFGALFGLSAATPDVQAWRERSRDWLRRKLPWQVRRMSAAREVELAHIARVELSDPNRRFAVGELPSMSLAEMIRYCVIRWHLVQSTPNAEQDRFYWLMEMVDYILQSPASPRSPGHGRERRKTAMRLLAPPPAEVMAHPLDGLPAYLQGRWSGEAVELVPPVAS